MKRLLLWLIVAFGLCVPIVPRLRALAEAQANRSPHGATVLGASMAMINVALLLVSTAMLVGGTYNPFLYFRF